jgi:hypothetical protein
MVWIIFHTLLHVCYNIVGFINICTKTITYYVVVIMKCRKILLSMLDIQIILDTWLHIRVKGTMYPILHSSVYYVVEHAFRVWKIKWSIFS